MIKCNPFYHLCCLLFSYIGLSVNLKMKLWIIVYTEHAALVDHWYFAQVMYKTTIRFKSPYHFGTLLRI